MNPLRTYIQYLHRKAAEAPEDVYIRSPLYGLPWFLLFFAIIPADVMFELSQTQRVCIVVLSGVMATIGIVTVTVIFIRENSAAARRQPPRYSE